MALTRTRTRTQPALTKLAMLVADVHGELEFVEWLLETEHAAQREAGAEIAAEAGLSRALERRQQELLAKRQALYETLRQFDPELDPSPQWIRWYRSCSR
ncbi:hypothetical protein FSC37_22245 [Piscinibacter aquaticus]|uniref:Uncharacterized protein n=1 Tax=Piscinibacter aquaticus TaxID=392597 RepID=A0A5C6TQ22_9BURK|nr:hypothetical protein FSC37_22245 [Piscinibacter aquaticus]